MSIFNEKLVITAGIFCATMVFGIMPIQLVKFLFADQTLVMIDTEDSEDRTSTSRRRSSSRRRDRRSGSTTFEMRREKRTARLKKVISYASCFSGGVFIAACLLDLLPGKQNIINNFKFQSTPLNISYTTLKHHYDWICWCLT